MNTSLQLGSFQPINSDLLFEVEGGSWGTVAKIVGVTLLVAAAGMALAPTIGVVRAVTAGTTAYKATTIGFATGGGILTWL